MIFIDINRLRDGEGMIKKLPYTAAVKLQNELREVFKGMKCDKHPGHTSFIFLSGKKPVKIEKLAFCCPEFEKHAIEVIKKAGIQTGSF